MRRTIIAGFCAFAAAGLVLVAPRLAGSVGTDVARPTCPYETDGAGLLLGRDRAADLCGSDCVIGFPPRSPWLCLPARGIGCSLGLARCWHGEPPARAS